MKNLLTSYNNSGISFVVSERDIVMSQLPSANIFKDAFVLLCDRKNNEIGRIKVCPGNSVGIRLSSLAEGLYYFCLYLKSPEKQNIYYPYFKYGDVPILVLNRTIELLDSLVLHNNLKFINSLNAFSKYDRRALSPTFHVQANNLNIKKLASQIAEGLPDKMSIIKAVHAWVALNISYDYDSLVDDAHVDKDNTALGAYVGRKCVCRGYTNLSVALLRSQHIPAIKVYCCALNIATDGGWWIQSNLQSPLNHVFTAAWNGTRWVIMDTTWDSKNVYEDGYFARGSSLAYPYKYFDVSLDFISQTHRFDAYDV
jgi:transglutaminase domain protein